MASSVERPNIRIEIQNNVREVEAMEVDEEEGEIVEKYEEPPSGKLQPPADVLGVAEKLAERARRFDLRPDETNPFTRSDLDDLYSSLGIDPASASDLCGDTILALGDPSTTSSDVLVYFYRYAPVEVGWLDDDGWFIVKFPDGGAAARALFYLSRPIDGVPVRRPTDALIDEEAEVTAEEEAGRSVLLRDRQVELRDEGLPEGASSFAPVPLSKPARKFKNSVDVSEVNVRIPPGYWRLGGPIGATEGGVLMRFGSRTDKKPFKVESLGRGYKKPGQISERQLRELRSIFERNKHMNQDRNPWGTLARSWDMDQLREPERKPEATGQFEVKNPDLLERLGRKTQHPDDAIDDDVTPPPEGPVMKRSKVPRMRMYADEEEEKVRRRKLLRTLKAQESRLAPLVAASGEEDSRDLRAVLTGGGFGRHATPADVITIDSDHDRDDLSLRLRNRTRNMVFTVRGREEEEEEEEEKEREEDRSDKSDIRSFLDRRRGRKGNPTEPQRSPPNRKRTAQSYSAHSRNRHMHSPTRRRRPERSPETAKPRSRVAVVVRKPPTRPTVASTIWRPESYTSSSDSSSSSSSDDSDSSNSSSEDEDGEEEEVVGEEVEEKRRSGGRVKVRLGARR